MKKFKNIATFLLSAILFVNVSKADDQEHMAYQLQEAMERGDMLKLVELFERVAYEYDGKPQGINAKGYLFNLYQGKCQSREEPRPLLGNGFPVPTFSEKHFALCKAMTNVPKSISLLEELANDLEDMARSSKISEKEKDYIYSQIRYTTSGLCKHYKDGSEELGISRNVLKANKYCKMYERNELRRK